MEDIAEWKEQDEAGSSKRPDRGDAHEERLPGIPAGFTQKHLRSKKSTPDDKPKGDPAAQKRSARSNKIRKVMEKRGFEYAEINNRHFLIVLQPIRGPLKVIGTTAMVNMLKTDEVVIEHFKSVLNQPVIVDQIDEESGGAEREESREAPSVEEMPPEPPPKAKRPANPEIIKMLNERKRKKKQTDHA